MAVVPGVIRSEPSFARNVAGLATLSQHVSIVGATVERLRRDGVDLASRFTMKQSIAAAHALASLIRSGATVPTPRAGDMELVMDILRSKDGRDLAMLAAVCGTDSTGSTGTVDLDCIPIPGAIGPGGALVMECKDVSCVATFSRPWELKFATCTAIPAPLFLNPDPTDPTPVPHDCFCIKADLWPLVSWIMLAIVIAAAIAGGIAAVLAILRMVATAIPWRLAH